MKTALMITAAVAAVLSLAACQKKTTTAETAGNEVVAVGNEAAPPADAMAPATANAAATPAAGVATTPAAAPTSTEGLLTGVTTSDLYQTEAGKIAEAKGQTPAVKSFGKLMITETSMTPQMKHIFVATKLTIPTELNAEQKAAIAQLNAASPADFDKVYLDQQKASQEQELALLKTYADGGDNKELKPAAAKAGAKVQAHLDKVHELQTAMK